MADKDAVIKKVSIPILRVGVQPCKTRRYNIPSCFNSHTARGSSTRMPLMRLTQSKAFQFPYCAWEFNALWEPYSVDALCFNSHTARGSSTLLCTKQKSRPSVSIPILRVGVQHGEAMQICPAYGFNSHTARGSSTAGICNAHFIKFLSHISADR